jgi:hypothetical protein
VYPGKLPGGGSFPRTHPTRETMRENGIGHGLVEQLHAIRLPVCPRMRPAETNWYAVDGYCVLDESPGWLMVPSIDIFRSNCTTPHFQECPWFLRGSNKEIRVPYQADVWAMMIAGKSCWSCP